MKKIVFIFSIIVAFNTNIFSQDLTLWANIYNGPANGSDVSSAITTDSLGNVYVTGVSQGETNITNDDFATIKYSTAGDVQWIQRYNRVLASSLYSIIGLYIAINDEGFTFVPKPKYTKGTAGSYAELKILLLEPGKESIETANFGSEAPNRFGS